VWQQSDKGPCRLVVVVAAENYDAVVSSVPMMLDSGLGEMGRDSIQAAEGASSYSSPEVGDRRLDVARSQALPNHQGWVDHQSDLQPHIPSLRAAC